MHKGNCFIWPPAFSSAMDEDKRSALYCISTCHVVTKGWLLPGAFLVYFPLSRTDQLIAVVAQSKAWFCGCSLAGIAGSNPADSIDICLLGVLCVLSGRGLCDGPITRPEWCE